MAGAVFSSLTTTVTPAKAGVHTAFAALAERLHGFRPSPE
jgi:hypothetical protein